MTDVKVENCDYCNKISTHEKLAQGRRQKFCCDHHIQHGGEAYILHDQCIIYGSTRDKTSITEFKASLASKTKQVTIFR